MQLVSAFSNYFSLELACVTITGKARSQKPEKVYFSYKYSPEIQAK